MRPSKRRWHTVSQLNRATTENVTIEKKERSHSTAMRMRIKREGEIRNIHETKSFRFSPIKKNS